MDIKGIIAEIKVKTRETGGIDGVYFTACGGSLLAMYPARYLLERESRNLRIGQFTANEFVHTPPKGLGPRSIVIACSLAGTPETAQACQTAKDAGACLIVFCGNPEAEISKLASYYIPFKSIFQPATLYMESNAAPALLIAFEILHQFEAYPYYEKALSAFNLLQGVVEDGKTYFEPRAAEFSEKHKTDKLIYSMASGPAMGVAYGFSICSLMEMQWINAPLVNTGEFFHGPFEIVDRTLPFVLFVSEGRCRPLDMRALDFLGRYAERITVVDAKELFINRFDDQVAEFFNHFVFDAAQRLLLANLARIRGHEMMTRRYMWHVEY